MECTHCGARTVKLIAAKAGIRCPACYTPDDKRNAGALNVVKFNKWGVRMTIADAMRIKTNKPQGDGSYCPAPRWSAREDRQQ
jgi:hypothetical protein